jgi:hypothetical protein
MRIAMSTQAQRSYRLFAKACWLFWGDAMNGFDVRAIGWVVTRDSLAEIVRAIIGARRNMSAEALESLSDRWRAVLACLPGPALSPRSERAMIDFVRHLVASCPQCYGEPVLRSRLLGAAAQTVIGLVGAATAFSFATPERIYLGTTAIVPLLMAAFSLISTIQLRLTYRILRRLIHAAAMESSRPELNTSSPNARPSESDRLKDANEVLNRH